MGHSRGMGLVMKTVLCQAEDFIVPKTFSGCTGHFSFRKIALPTESRMD